MRKLSYYYVGNLFNTLLRLPSCRPALYIPDAVKVKPGKRHDRAKIENHIGKEDSLDSQLCQGWFEWIDIHNPAIYAHTRR